MKKLKFLALIGFCISCTAEKDSSTAISFFPELENREGLYYQKGEEEPFTGFSKSTYSNGNTYVNADFKNGKLHGTYTAWKKNGEKMGETIYKNGKKNGVSISWHLNGQKASEVHFVDNKKEGRLLVYYEDGSLNAEAFFKNDQLDSTYTRWDLDGNVISVQVYEDGELVE